MMTVFLTYSADGTWPSTLTLYTRRALAAAVMLLNPFAEHLLKKSALLRASLMKSLATA